MVFHIMAIDGLLTQTYNLCIYNHGIALDGTELSGQFDRGPVIIVIMDIIGP